MSENVLAKALRGERLTVSEAAEFYRETPLLEAGLAADAARRRLHCDDAVTYVVDRNINYTNVCTNRCRFCAFFREADAPDAYVLTREEIFRKVEETLALGGTGILMQGGLHPGLDLPFFESLLLDIRSRYRIDLHCFSPPEVLYLAEKASLPVDECLRRLVTAGLSSLPGGGAEILDDAVRSRVSPAKCSAAQWMGVMEAAHGIGLKTTATMMFGCGETLEERLHHLDLVRSLQDRTGGFVSFIPWTFQWPRTDLGREGWAEATAVEYLRMVALARVFLDNVPGIQASWVTQGLKVAQVSLRFGANDMGSVMIEENVVAATGTTFRTNEAELCRLIRDAGFVPQRRNNVHGRIAVPEPPRR